MKNRGLLVIILVLSLFNSILIVNTTEFFAKSVENDFEPAPFIDLSDSLIDSNVFYIHSGGSIEFPLYMEAQEGQLSNFESKSEPVTHSHDNASYGDYIEAESSGSATYTFSVPEDGDYTVYVRVKDKGTLFDIYVDGAYQFEYSTLFEWDNVTLGYFNFSRVWKWDKVTDEEYTNFFLTEGEHTIEFVSISPYAKIDQVYFTKARNRDNPWKFYNTGHSLIHDPELLEQAEPMQLLYQGVACGYYNGVWDCYGNNSYGDIDAYNETPTVEHIQRVVADNRGRPVIFDIESYSLHPRPFNITAHNATHQAELDMHYANNITKIEHDRYILIETLKLYRQIYEDYYAIHHPDKEVIIGLYGYLGGFRYSVADAYSEFFNSILSEDQEIADEVDFISPLFYVNYDDNITAAIYRWNYMINHSNYYGKPVYPFIRGEYAEYHDEPSLQAQVFSEEEWDQKLQYIYDNSDGTIFWGSGYLMRSQNERELISNSIYSFYNEIECGVCTSDETCLYGSCISNSLICTDTCASLGYCGVQTVCGTLVDCGECSSEGGGGGGGGGGDNDNSFQVSSDDNSTDVSLRSVTNPSPSLSCENGCFYESTCYEYNETVLVDTVTYICVEGNKLILNDSSESPTERETSTFDNYVSMGLFISLIVTGILIFILILRFFGLTPYIDT